MRLGTFESGLSDFYNVTTILRKTTRKGKLFFIGGYKLVDQNKFNEKLNSKIKIKNSDFSSFQDALLSVNQRLLKTNYVAITTILS